MANKETKEGFWKEIKKIFEGFDSPVMEDLVTRMSRKIIQRSKDIRYDPNGDDNFSEKDIPGLFEKLGNNDYFKSDGKPAAVEQDKDGKEISIEFGSAQNTSKITIEGMGEGLPLSLTRESTLGGIKKRVQIDDIKYFPEILAREISETKDITF